MEYKNNYHQESLHCELFPLIKDASDEEVEEDKFPKCTVIIAVKIVLAVSLNILCAIKLQ